MTQKLTIGLLVGNRGFFPAWLCREGRQEVIGVLQRLGWEVVTLTPNDTRYGSVETSADAAKCAELFRQNASHLDGVVVTLPNFGDERAVADALRWSGLQVPVLIHAFPDDPAHMDVRHRRDSFCGKLSVCNNLRQYGIRFSLTRSHTVSPASEEFEQELRWFGAVCRTVRGLRGARIGAVGARPMAFKTVRYSEKLLERAGISVETLDLSEVLGRCERLSDRDRAVRAQLAELRARFGARGIPAASLVKMAKLAVVLGRWVEAEQLSATAIQCWTAIEEYFGVVPCAVMSLMSEALRPSACEVDVLGAVAMRALALASEQPAALLDWNNNYGDDPDRCVMFHCSNLPPSMLDQPEMGCQDIIAGTVGKENAYGTVVGRIRAGPFTFARISTDDTAGMVRTYTGEGVFESATLQTFGGYGVAYIPGLSKLLREICLGGFEHHVAVTRGQVSRAIAEAFSTYFGWPTLHHNG